MKKKYRDIVTDIISAILKKELTYGQAENVLKECLYNIKNLKLNG